MQKGHLRADDRRVRERECQRREREPEDAAAQDEDGEIYGRGVGPGVSELFDRGAELGARGADVRGRDHALDGMTAGFRLGMWEKWWDWVSFPLIDLISQ